MCFSFLDAGITKMHDYLSIKHDCELLMLWIYSKFHCKLRNIL